jgi:hypothetical protein
MSANQDGRSPIKYLSVDEMMLKITEMRAATAALEQEESLELLSRAAQPEEIVPTPPLTEEVTRMPAPRVFPEYVSHCELWSRNDDRRRTSELKPIPSVTPLPSVRSGRQVSIPRGAPAKLVVRRDGPLYLLGSVGAIVGAVLLALALQQLKPATPDMMMSVPVYGDLVAGRDPANEPPNDDAVLPAASAEVAPRHVHPKIAPEQLEADVHQMLASNGFPDIGVSASHRGEVYLAGEVFSADETENIVKVAKLASNGGKVFFLHPEVREPQGSTFFGAIPEHAPDVWGARVRNVVIGSPAYKAGIRIGDIIREFGHATVGGANDLEKAVANHKPGERVTVRIWRSGSIKYSIARLTGLAEFASR